MVKGMVIRSALMQLTHPGRKVITGLAGAGLIAGSLAAAPAAQAAVGDMAVFSMGTNAAPQDIAAGPDGNLWVTNTGSNTIAKVSTAGVILQNYSLPTGSAGVRDITVGPDGNLWFTETAANKIGKITTAGVITEYTIPTNGSQPYGISAGPDGALWFTEFAGNKIGRITTDGAITNEYPLPSGVTAPYDVINGPQGSSRVYYTASGNGYVGFLTMSGAFGGTATSSTGSSPRGMVLNQGSVWFTMYGLSSLGNLVNDTTVASIPIGQQSSYMAIGPSNTMWITTASNQVMQLNDRGAAVGTYAIPAANSTPAGITQGPDGNMWVALPGASAIARVSTGQVPTSTAAPAITPTTGVVVGTTLTTSPGTWNGTPTSYTYQWQRCSSTAASSCANIAGANAATYTVQAADNSQYLRAGVAAVNGSGTSEVVYAPAVQAGSGATPTPTPTPSGGNTASIGNGATMELDAPAKQKRKTRKTYDVIFSAPDVQGTVTLQFRNGKKRNTYTNLPIKNGLVEFAWKVRKNWPLKKTTVVATFVPAAGSKYTAAQVTDTVKIRK